MGGLLLRVDLPSPALNAQRLQKRISAASDASQHAPKLRA
jgi:hypothetical protein